jgi:catechol 2,3-dioxygenase-like lactoylglutathione lyase family enzyme
VEARIDHVVLWVEDPLRSVLFYEEVVGFPGVRLDEFRDAKVPFPSVRLSNDALIDLMPKAMAPKLSSLPGAAGSAGNKVNHLCFSVSRADYEALRARLAAREVPVPVTMKDSFGAQGHAPEAFYFADPDGNVLEARYYP